MQKLKLGAFEKGSHLPPARELAKMYGSSIAPVYAAIMRLEKDGIVKRLHGSGVRVEALEPVRRVARMNPTVDLVTSIQDLGNPDGLRRIFRHKLDAIQQILMARLSRQGDLRLMLSSFAAMPESVTFRTRIEDALELRPTVFVFARPEYFNDEEAALLRKLQKEGTFVIHYAARRKEPAFDRVTSDFRSGQRALTEYLLEKGHLEIVRVATSLASEYERDKEEGIKDALLANDDKDRVSTVVCEIQPERDWRIVDRYTTILGDIRERFPQATAVMLPSDAHVAAGRLALRLLGWKDVELTGYDNNWRDYDGDDPLLRGVTVKNFEAELSSSSYPATVDANLPDIGEALARLVIGRAHGQLPPEPQEVMVPQTFVPPAAR
jgi:hypothetical protein